MRKETEIPGDRLEIVKILCEVGIPLEWISEKVNISQGILRGRLPALGVSLTRGKTKESIFTSSLRMYQKLYRPSDSVEAETAEILAQYLGADRILASFRILDLIAETLNQPRIDDAEKGFLNLIVAIQGEAWRHTNYAENMWEEFIDGIFYVKTSETTSTLHLDMSSGPKNSEELTVRFCSFWANTQREKIGADWRNNKHVIETFDEVLGSLEPRRDEEIIRKRFGIGLPKPITLKELGDQYGHTSGNYARICESRALRRLRHPSRARKLTQLYFLKPQTVDEEKTARDRLQETKQLEIKAEHPKEALGKKEMLDEFYYLSISELNLSIRSENCLHNAGIRFAGELVQKTEEQLLKIQNFGYRSLTEIKNVLKEAGLSLGMSIENWQRPSED